MLFNSWEYAALLTVAFLGSWGLGRLRLLRVLFLLAASYLFYAFWSPAYLLLIFASSTLDFLVGSRLHAAKDPGPRRAWLLLSLAGNLGLLGTFKYFNFFSTSLAAALSASGIQATALQLEVIVPVGISFYTFQSLSYTIDIYRRRLEPEKNPLYFFLFVAFFPQLVAGPIVRAAEFLPQLKGTPLLNARAGSQGLFFIALGLAKKGAVADLLAVNLVDRIFETPALYTSAELLLGIYGYALQIYCDFSAYSDIAIGSALLLGFTLPKNFNAPYRARNLQDFWRRWHISLSSWLRDYLYIGLGGSRGQSSWITYRNLAITMLLGGLWHGAAWTFVIWGAIHGLGLSLTRAWQRRYGQGQWGTWTRIPAVLLTFHLVCLAWIFFRSPDLPRAWEILHGLAQLSGGTANITPMLWGILAAGFATHLMPDVLFNRLQSAWTRWPAPLQGGILVVVVLAIRLAGTSKIVPFIYFQF